MYKTFIRPFLQKFDHESAQHTTKSILHAVESNPISLSLLGLLADKGKRFTHPKLHTTVEGITFDNPLLLAAGWDKEGIAVKAMHQLGFGGVEVGTVTAYPQPGNPRPRLHLMDDDVALNYLGFNSPGMEEVAQNLRRYKNSGIPIGINVSKNKYVTAVGAAPLYAVVVRRLYELGDYFVINVSSPNTAGLKVLQGKQFLEEIVKEVLGMMEDIGGRKPTFVKIAPDIAYQDLDGVIEVVMQYQLAGIIAVNTFAHSNSLAKYGRIWEDRQGGLSGNDKHYRSIGNRYLAYIHNQTQGKITTIGVGGVHDTQTALEKISAGATLIQAYTGLFAEGPSLPGNINRGLVNFMEKEKIKSLDEIRGTAAKEIWENKFSQAFSFIQNASSIETLKKEYMDAIFQKSKNDTLLISPTPYQLKHGELERKTSHIYLNHRIPLFNLKEYRRLFGKILHTFIREKLGLSHYGLISVPSSGSLDITNALMESNNDRIDRVVALPNGIALEEKGAHTPLYGKINNDKQWIMIDDVFTSGKTMKNTLSLLQKEHQLPKKIVSVTLAARNVDSLESFEAHTNSSALSFVTLDEILTHHWTSFSDKQKKLIREERQHFQ